MEKKNSKISLLLSKYNHNIECSIYLRKTLQLIIILD